MDSDYIMLRDVSYGEHDRHTVDIFIPNELKNQSGLILYIHGGGWTQGDKSVHFDDARYFCNYGYVSATMNYRYVSEQINVFDELEDIASALRAIRMNCSAYKIDIDKVILCGGSAGAHLALLYAYIKRNFSDILPVAVCAYCPPVSCNKSDFLLGITGEFEDWKYGILSLCCGQKISKEGFNSTIEQTALKKISPAEYVTSACVPTAVFHGRKDEIIPMQHILDFTSLLKSFGVDNDLLIYEHSGHALDKDEETALKAKLMILQYAEKYF